MGQVKKDWEEQVSERAEELAQERYHVDFGQLSPSLQMSTWIEAEHQVDDKVASELDAARDKVREKGTDHWGELELARRLGK